MKNLVLVRHAKSSWEYDVIDHERPLKDRGINDAKIISEEFNNQDMQIDKVLISDANRTKLTAEIFKKVLRFNPDICSYNHNLYDFSGELLTKVIKRCDDSIKNLMVFGHNYAITNFVNSYGDKYFENVPTSGLVWLEFHTKHWKDINEGKTKLYLFPRDFK
jgi:phosphohistidine phosphatase